MEKGKAFVLVGHENWGKSRTLKALTDGSNKRRYYSIDEKVFFIKRMSNDDVPWVRGIRVPDHLINFVRNVKQNQHPLIIITLCPNFHDNNRKTCDILNELKKKYEIYFFILIFKYNYRSDGDIITEDQIKRLKNYGDIELFSEKHVEASERSTYFKKFIRKIIY